MFENFINNVYNKTMAKQTYDEITLREPTILDVEKVMDMRKEFLNTHCKFNGTSNLNIYDNYIDWLAYTINQTQQSSFNNNSNCTKFSYLAISKEKNILIGMIEIIFYYDLNLMQKRAHIIECVRPSKRRQGYGKILIKKAIEECISYGLKKYNLTYERNSKASRETMSKIIDF